MRRALLAVLLLAACGREPEAPPAEIVSFRDQSVPIGSTTRGATGDLAGEWVVSQSFAGAFARPGSRVVVSEGADGRVTWAIDGWTVVTEADGPGRYRWDDLRLWVLWVDDDFRTAVVGTPDGRLGWIMDRPGQASGDRTVAARVVLDWNGYDVARLAG